MHATIIGSAIGFAAIVFGPFAVAAEPTPAPAVSSDPAPAVSSDPAPKMKAAAVDAAGAVDGVKDGKWGFHTSLEPSPWWQVDLGRSVPLERALIFNDDAKTWREVYRHDGRTFGGVTDGNPLAVPLKGDAARFLRIQLPGTEYLHLDEVEVYGKDDPKKNIALGRPADQSSISAWSRGVAKSPSPTAKRPAAQREPALHLGLVRLDMEAEWQREFRVLAAQIADRRRQPPETEVYHREAMILPDDRDGVDVVVRRSEALWADLAGPAP
ncbi:MAG: hypothetical protein ABSH20_32195, partial [Tepidisphaeraceae bacterium]